MSSYPSTSLEPGMSGDAVKQLQQYLISKGYSIPDGATGYYGNQTKAAVLQYQNDLGVDYGSYPGYWGPKTMAAATNMTGDTGATTTQVTQSPSVNTGGTTNNQTVTQPGQNYSGTTGFSFSGSRDIGVMEKERLQEALYNLGLPYDDAAIKTVLEAGGRGSGTNWYDYQIVKNKIEAGTFDPKTVLSAATQNQTPSGTTNTTSGTISTGNAQLDGLYEQMKNMLDQMYAAGGTINKKINLDDPAEMQKFYDQAETELGPYYQSLFKAAKQDLYSYLDVSKKAYELKKASTLDEFKQSLGTQREAAAGAGTAFSGARALGEKQLSDTASRSLESLYNTTGYDIGGKIREYTNKYGTDTGLTTALPQYTASAAGRGLISPERTTTYAPEAGIVGSEEYAARSTKKAYAQQLATRASEYANATPMTTTPISPITSTTGKTLTQPPNSTSTYTPIISAADYQLKPGETIDAYNTRIKQLRGW